jgi:cytosine/adenosine deaminase-related metal-dependent hydrolase
MILSNIQLLDKPGFAHILVKGEKIISVFFDDKLISANEPVIDCEGGLAFPGLINSHDHLEFNLLPQLGNRIYKNYTEWGDDIHRNNKIEMEKILKIPLELRVQWGIYKNLLNGITTVVNHGEKLKIKNDLITIFQNCYCLHSPSFEKKWKWKLNHFQKKKLPVVIHAGEGTDEFSRNEIDKLINWNFFKKEIIVVHGVAMNEEQAKHFKALIWCPASNYFLLGKTADIRNLKSKTKILFGTDSTLTASWNIWQHIRLAKEQQMVSANEIFEMLTQSAAEKWNLNSAGVITENNYASIVVAKTKTNSGKWDNFFEINPENISLVIHKGKIRLFENDLKNQLLKYGISLDEYSEFSFQGKKKNIWGKLPDLIKKIHQYGEEVNLPELSF